MRSRSHVAAGGPLCSVARLMCAGKFCARKVPICARAMRSHQPLPWCGCGALVWAGVGVNGMGLGSIYGVCIISNVLDPGQTVGSLREHLRTRVPVHALPIQTVTPAPRLEVVR